MLIWTISAESTSVSVLLVLTTTDFIPWNKTEIKKGALPPQKECVPPPPVFLTNFNYLDRE